MKRISPKERGNTPLKREGITKARVVYLSSGPRVKLISSGLFSKQIFLELGALNHTVGGDNTKSVERYHWSNGLYYEDLVVYVRTEIIIPERTAGTAQKKIPLSVF